MRSELRTTVIWIAILLLPVRAWPQSPPTEPAGNGQSVSPAATPSQNQSPIHFPDATTNPSQDQNSPSGQVPVPSQSGDLLLNGKDFDANVWANAKTYVDLPVADVEAAVPELQGLEAETNQEGLSSLLDGIGKSCEELMHHTPNVASREEQDTSQRIVSRMWQGVMQPVSPPPSHEHQEFQYLLLSRPTETGIEFHEYRTDKQGHPVGSSGSHLGQMTEGFVSEWLRLLPGNQPQLRFRYLGQQEVDKRKTLVVAFAQIPGKARFPAQFTFDGTPITVLFQGVVWVDASNFRIVRMREDLLAPRPDIYLKQLTAQIRFGEVAIEKASTALWLPQAVMIAWEYKGLLAEQRHVYSDYRLYAVKTRIITQ